MRYEQRVCDRCGAVSPARPVDAQREIESVYGFTVARDGRDLCATCVWDLECEAEQPVAA